MRILVFGDSNSWGTPPDGSGLRLAARWPRVMAELLEAELVEDALPGRTTCHDDPQMHGAVQNGRAALEIALYAQRPLDLVLIMLGTNDMKRRFAPSAGKVAGHVMGLVDLVARVGGGPGPWEAVNPPLVGLIAPVPLGAQADDPGWDRFDEWQGGRAPSLELAGVLADLAARRDVPVLDAGAHVAASAQDPIHIDAAAHERLGQAVAYWVGARGWCG